MYLPSKPEIRKQCGLRILPRPYCKSWFRLRYVRAVVVANMSGLPTIVLFLTAWPWQSRLNWHSIS